MGADVVRLERAKYEPPCMFDTERDMPRGTLPTATHDPAGWRRFHEEHARPAGPGFDWATWARIGRAA